MKLNMIKYYIRDAADGIRRNLGATLACILIIFVTLSFSGAFFLVKTGVDNLTDFLESQLNIKVFVDQALNTEEVATILEGNNLIRSVEIETQEETLGQLQNFFEGREHLFQAFHESALQDTILLELENSEDVVLLAEQLEGINGITDVVYAQQFAETVLTWTGMANKYGSLILIIFAIISFIFVYLSINLALYQRKQDIRVKLLFGAKEMHVRSQFLFEGIILGLVGGILASFSLYFFQTYFLSDIATQFSAIFQFSASLLNQVMIGVMVFGMVIGLLGSYLSTRKMMQYA